MNLSQLALPATSAAPHLFWLLSRAAGSAALVLSSLSVCLGLLMGGRLLKRRGTDLRVTHEALSLATLATLLVHGLSLLGDGFLHPSLADVAIPFAGAYKTFWTSAGIVARSSWTVPTIVEPSRATSTRRVPARTPGSTLSRQKRRASSIE